MNPPIPIPMPRIRRPDCRARTRSVSTSPNRISSSSPRSIPWRAGTAFSSTVRPAASTTAPRTAVASSTIAMLSPASGFSSSSVERLPPVDSSLSVSRTSPLSMRSFVYFTIEDGLRRSAEARLARVSRLLSRSWRRIPFILSRWMPGCVSTMPSPFSP